jgi:hypothetical protein
MALGLGTAAAAQATADYLWIYSSTLQGGPTASA